ncbi:zinc-binding dehydrogenase [Dactylosporangium sp. McL0621]|uniref:zinc-binding dehydrogenase n=1 Tax=Dactylosporangium sp. McL0621 TaxID=3415678 RepID=UPI003CED3CCD
MMLLGPPESAVETGETWTSTGRAQQRRRGTRRARLGRLPRRTARPAGRPHRTRGLPVQRRRESPVRDSHQCPAPGGARPRERRASRTRRRKDRVHRRRRDRQLTAQSRITATNYLLDNKPARLRWVSERLATGSLVAPIDREVSLAEAPQAVQTARQGGARGKTLIRVD